MTKQRFSPRVEAALRELAGLPWEVTVSYGVRCEKVCPVCAAAASEAGVFGWMLSWAGAAREAGWSLDEWRPVADAADLVGHPLRSRLLELLGVSQ